MSHNVTERRWLKICHSDPHKAAANKLTRWDAYGKLRRAIYSALRKDVSNSAS